MNQATIALLAICPATAATGDTVFTQKGGIHDDRNQRHSPHYRFCWPYK